MKKTVFYGLLVILLAFSVLFISCGDSSDNDDDKKKTPPPTATPTPTPTPPDPTVSPIEAAFRNMLRTNFSTRSDLSVIKPLGDWGQTDAEYSLTRWAGGRMWYELCDSFGTVQILYDGNPGVYMGPPNAGIVWGTPTGDTGYISYDDDYDEYGFSPSTIPSQVTYPFTVSFPEGSTTQVINGTLSLQVNTP